MVNLMFSRKNEELDTAYIDKLLNPTNSKLRRMLHLILRCSLIGLGIFILGHITSTLFFTDDNFIPVSNTLPPDSNSAQSPSVSKDDNLSNRIIVLDPGHGGIDPGCTYNEIQEHNITLELSFLIRDVLIEKGYQVIMTREKNEYVSLKERVEIANTRKAGLFISIHINAFEDENVSGIETWFNPHTNPQNSTLAECIQQSTVAATHAKNRGTYPSSELVVTRDTLIPSCLVEVGYLTNPSERASITNSDYQIRLAQSIADGIEEWSQT